MPPLKINQFMGYSSKPGLENNLALASRCENMIINKGDLCNHPYTQKTVHRHSTKKRRLNVFYQHKYIQVQILITSFQYYFIIDSYFSDNVEKEIQYDSYNHLNNLWPLRFNQMYDKIMGGNFIQIGDWLYFLSQFDYLIDTFDTHVYQYGPPRMIRFRLPRQALEYPGQEWIQPALIGVDAPHAVVNTGSTGTYGIAISFEIMLDNFSPGVTTDPLGAESLAIIDDDDNLPATPSGHDIKVYLPKHMNRIEPSHLAAGTRVAIYSKNSEQSIYYFSQYSYIIEPPIEDIDAASDYVGYYYVTLSDTTIGLATQDTSRPAPLINRAVPKPAFHGCQFKDRLYYLSVNGEFADWPINQVEYSQKIIGEEANYVEGNFRVGNEKSAGSGCVIFFGQLVIFKRHETYVLTDDALVGETRKLFEEPIGCVNEKGGHGYIVINDILYWAADDGIYAYDGASRPIRISEVIQEDLEKIPFDTYQYVRFGHDPRYGLLYILFPFKPDEVNFNNQYPGFIYHYNELNEKGIGKWTRIINFNRENLQLSQILQTKDNKIIFCIEDYFHKIGKLNEGTLLSSAYVPYIYWKTGLLNINEPHRTKHWKMLKLAGQLINQQFIISTMTSYGLHVNHSSDVKNGQSLICHLGRFMKQFQLEFSPIPSNKPFRIQNMSLDVKLRGRR